jgi:uncharacterized membrane protein
MAGAAMAGRNWRFYRGAEGRRMGGPVGCLIWLIILIVLLIIAALMFGGFQKGTKYSSQPGRNAQEVVVTAAVSPGWPS